MDQDTLQLFSRQLSLWAETAISRGRYPFRRVETDPLLLTEEGEFRPPLVFWINRDSFMAGGVLLLPPKDAEDSVEMGRRCASALGLRHFVTWAPREIVFWEERGGEVARCKTLALHACGDPAADDFRDALTAVMEELKVLSVLGAVPPAQLSPHYLVNLCRTALDASLPYIEEAYRVIRGERRLEETAPAGELALRKGMLTLLRLLGLVFHDRLPSTVQPEGLERAMQFASDTLPAALRTAFQPAAGEIPLPPEGAVRFHHLLRRLTQLRCGKDRHRAARVLEILLTNDGALLGASPFPSTPARTAGLTMRINPGGLSPEGEETVEVGSPSLLALLALLRELKSLPPARLQATDPFVLSFTTPLSSVEGTLTDQRIPEETERRILAAHLRTSWPTRRFPLPRRTPAWAWSFIHLLGMARQGAEIEVHTPREWLSAEYGKALLHLLAEEYALHFLAPCAGGMLRMRLVRGNDPEAVTTVVGPDGPRLLSWPGLGAGRHILLRLALDLPAPLFHLLEEEVLLLPEETAWPETAERAIFLYTRSALGVFLWELVSGGLPLPSRPSLRPGILRFGLPLPSGRILAELRQLSGEEAEGLSQSAFDTELSRLLGTKLSLPERPARKSRSRSASGAAGERLAGGELAAQITASVFVDGLPRFPEQYLYGHFRPPLNEHEFAGPLQICEEFFGRVKLRDQKGKVLEVDGIESARALLLASYSNRSPVALPVERQLTAAILARYLADLNALRRELVRQCHLQLAEQRAADALAEQVWDALPLPPWPLVEG